MRKVLLPLLAVVAFFATAQPASATLTPYKVSISSSASSIEWGKTFTLTGVVWPGAKGKTVYIQRKIGTGAWTTITTRTLSSTSKYSATIKPGPGPASYRISKPKSSTHSAGASAAKTVNVFRWRSLLDLPNTRTPGSVYSGTVLIKGYTFTKSFSVKQGEYVDWNLGGKRCDRLKAYIGIDDDSVAGTTGTSYITNQGFGIINSESGLAIGQSARYVQASLGTTTIRFLPGVTASTSQAWVAYGSPQVHCNS